MPLHFLCYTVLHNLLKSLAVVFFQALVMEKMCYHNVCCALTAYKPVSGLIVYSLCKNIVMEYSHMQK
jgi:hypothetical protein